MSSSRRSTRSSSATAAVPQQLQTLFQPVARVSQLLPATFPRITGIPGNRNTNNLFGRRPNGDEMKNEYPIDKIYSSLDELKTNYRRYYKRRPYLSSLEQIWTSEFFTPLTDLMGEQTFILPVFFEVEFRQGSHFHPEISDKNRIVYSGAHFRSRKAGSSVTFDPYDEFQIDGSNQFCQTIALMHLFDKLGEPSQDRSFRKYYEYSRRALNFIKETIEKLTTIYVYDFSWINQYVNAEYSLTKSIIPYTSNISTDPKIAKKQMLAKVNECIAHYPATVNVIQYN